MFFSKILLRYCLIKIIFKQFDIITALSDVSGNKFKCVSTGCMKFLEG